jgi:UDP-2-acetamido-3-amino-2,3-dideoxy-glucuronate N-acetyltransferase
MAGATIGQGCSIGQNCFVASGASIGNRCKLQNNVSVYDGVILEDEVFCGPSVVFTNVVNPRAFIERKSEYRPTYIRQGVTLGANATIVCGVEIGEYAFVGAGSVVTRDVPPHALVVGVPGREKGWVSRAGLRLDFDAAGAATCPETGERYRRVDGGEGIERLTPATQPRTLAAIPSGPT